MSQLDFRVRRRRAVYVVKGIVIGGIAGEFDPRLLDRPWFFASSEHRAEIEALLGYSSDNMADLVDSYHECALLIVTSYIKPSFNGSEIARFMRDYAEGIVAAVNYSWMATGIVTHSGNVDGLSIPAPIQLPTYPKQMATGIIYNDKKEGFAGTTVPFQWPNFGDPYVTTLSEIDAAIQQVNSPLLRAMLDHPADRTPFSISLRALARANDSVSIGQFVAVALSGLDMLLGAADWKLLKSLVCELCLPDNPDRIFEMFDIRNAFVHRLEDPIENIAGPMPGNVSLLPARCAAICAATIFAYTTVLKKYIDRSAALSIIHASERIRNAASIHPQPASTLPSPILTFTRGPLWTRYYL